MFDFDSFVFGDFLTFKDAFGNRKKHEKLYKIFEINKWQSKNVVVLADGSLKTISGVLVYYYVYHIHIVLISFEYSPSKLY